MKRQDGAVCDRDCGHCAFPDCIAPEEDISPEERAWSEQLDRETAADAAHKAARDEAARKERARAYRQAYYAANRARIQEYSKRYWAAHKAEIAAKRAARYQKNKAARDAYSKAYQAAHRDEINARQRAKLREKREKAAAAAAQPGARDGGSGGPVLPGALQYVWQGEGVHSGMGAAAAGGIPAAPVQMAAAAPAGDAVPDLRGLESASALPDAAAAGGGRDAGQYHPLLGVPAGGAETPLKKRERPVGAETQPDAQKQKGRNFRWPTRKTRQTARPTYRITRERAKLKRRRRHGLF